VIVAGAEAVMKAIQALGAGAPNIGRAFLWHPYSVDDADLPAWIPNFGAVTYGWRSEDVLTEPRTISALTLWGKFLQGVEGEAFERAYRLYAPMQDYLKQYDSLLLDGQRYYVRLVGDDGVRPRPYPANTGGWDSGSARSTLGTSTNLYVSTEWQFEVVGVMGV
jgi:hypothetical protein